MLEKSRVLVVFFALVEDTLIFSENRKIIGCDLETVIAVVVSQKEGKMTTKRPVKRTDDTNPLLRILFEDFQARNRYKNLTDITIKTYAQTFEHFLAFVGNDATGEDITEKTIIGFVEMLRAREIRPSSVNHYLRGLRAFLYWCMDNGHVERFKIIMLKEQEPVKETYTEEELALLLREPKQKASFAEWRTWAVINWMLDNGNRAETVCSVCMRDFSLDKQEVILSHTKNKKAQILPISDDLAEVLRKYIRIFRRDTLDDDFLFPNITGEKMTVNALKLSVRNYNQSRGVTMNIIRKSILICILTLPNPHSEKPVWKP